MVLPRMATVVVWCSLLVLGMLTPGRVLGLDCTKKGPCSCSSPKGDIDLSPLDGHGTPKFKDKSTTTGDIWLYSWNPCSAFTEGSCTDASGCQVSTDGKETYKLGTQDSASFQPDPSTDNVILQYTATDGGTQRTLEVTLICDPSSESSLDVSGETPPGSLTYLMTLKSKHCCPGAPSTSPSEGISVGSILLIAFFSLVLVYILGGVLFMIFVRKANGREAVPNYSFWSVLPGLIKDGTLFTFRCCCSLCGRRESYDKI